MGDGGIARKKRFVFRARPEALSPLARFARPVAALANNHSMDYGPAGLAATIDALDRLGIAHAGGGRTKDQATAAVGIVAGKETVSVLSFGFDEERRSYDERGGACIAPLEPSAMERLVAASAASATATVVMLHWGIEYEARFNGYQRELARSLVRAGADLVVGTGPHVMQGIEAYRGSLICYSLGNLVFDDLGSDETTATFIVRMTLDRRVGGAIKKRFAIAPLRTKDIAQGPARPERADAERIVAALAGRSPDPAIVALRPHDDSSGIEWFPLE